MEAADEMTQARGDADGEAIPNSGRAGNGVLCKNGDGLCLIIIFPGSI